MNSVPNAKLVIFDVSSEYGINILDMLRSFQSRVVLTEALRNTTSSSGNESRDKGDEDDEDEDNTTAKVGDYLRRHISPDSLTDMTNMLLVSIEEIVTGNKIRTIDISSDAEQMM